MTTRRIDFGNLNDGIDWANALPPHIVSQQELQRASQARPAERSMFMRWPIPEASFPLPPSVRRRREMMMRVMGTSDVQTRGGRRTFGELSQRQIQHEWDHEPLSQTFPQRRQLSEPLSSQRLRRERAVQQVQQRRPQQQQQQASSVDESIAAVTQLANTMLGRHHVEAVLAFDEFVSANMQVAQMAAETAMALSMQQSMMPTPGTVEMSGNDAEEEPMNYTRVVVSVRGSSSSPPQVTTTVQRGLLRARQRPRHIGSSGSDYDIITGFSRVPQLAQLGAGEAPRAQIGGNTGWELNDFSYENLLELDNAKVPTGLPQHQLRGMKAVPYSSMKRSADKMSSTTRSSEEQEACTICLEKMTQGAMVLPIDCGHTFHHKCIIRWLARNNCCPTCRREVPRKGRALQ
ncbi:putative zinc finger protein [Trypanosoma grayi]|uniref:putative zinc finger protein n=1 Tax=Trypanosoma grayi TaxID=71804 RepID=UPI0004F41F75|nr:putative zinc finger protein [Trypanosoma grayi]KEG11989.1 putative zinc finger protein [Trypanosoma grayi]